MKYIWIVILIALTAGVVYAGVPTKPLKGGYIVAGQTILDPAPTEPKDTHFRIYLEGDSARSLYQSMKVKATRDFCLDDGSVTKNIGDMSCTRHDNGSFNCAFAIDVMRQQISGAQVC